VSISESILNLAYVPLGTSAIWCVWRFNRLRKEFRVLAAYVLLSAAVQGVAEVLSQFGINNLSLSHAYTVLGFLFLNQFYKMLLDALVPSIWFKGLSIGFVLFAIATVLFWQPLDTFNSATLTVQAVVLIIYALSTFILTLTEGKSETLKVKLKSLNWINSGMFIYFSGSMLLFFNGGDIMHSISEDWTRYMWILHDLLVTVLHSFLLVGLWISLRD